MALFEKKSPVDKLFSAYDLMSDEDKKSFKSKLGDIDKEEDEREIDKIEEKKAETPEVKDEKAEEKEEETKEIGKEVDEAEEMEDADKMSAEPEEKAEESEQNKEIADGFEARLKSLEEKISAILSKDEESKDVGISGFGKNGKDNIDTDNREKDVIKKLGGFAR